MSTHDQALYFNALPLLVMSALYMLVSVALVPALWRERRRLGDVELTLALVFPCVGLGAAIAGLLLLDHPEPLGGRPLVGLAAIVVASVPGLVFVAHWSDRALLLTGSRRAREAEERSSVQERARDDLKAFADQLGRTPDDVGVARLLVERAVAWAGVEFACVWSVEGRRARGLFALLDGHSESWFPDMELDLDGEPSAAAGVVADGRPIVVQDAATSPLINPRMRALVEPKSGAFVPLVAAERVIAVLAVVTTRSERHFGDEELRLLQEFCSEAALALERARSARALARALERERLVARIARNVRSELDVGAVFGVAATETGRALGVDRAVIRLAGRGGVLDVAADWPGDTPGTPPAPPPDSPVAELAAREARTVAVSNVAAADELAGMEATAREQLTARDVLAALATPIVVSGSVLGVFEAHCSAPHAWSADEIDLAEAVAREVGLAAQTAQLVEQNEVRLRQQTALLTAAQVVASELEPGTVLARLVEEVADLVGADAADFYVLDAERNVLRCAAVRGLPEDVIGFEFPARQGLAGEALERKRAVLADNYTSTAEPVEHASYRGFEHAMVAPVTWSGAAHGVLGVGNRVGGRPFASDDLDVLETFAGLAALALRNAEAFEDRSRQARVQRAFFRIASVLGEPLALAGTFDAVAQAAAEALDGTSAAVLMSHGDALELTGEYELPTVLTSALEGGSHAEEHILVETARTGRIVAAPDVAHDGRFSADLQRLATEAGIAALLAVPVQAGLEPDGSGVVLVFFAAPRRFADDDVELAQHLGGAARGALERSALYEEERRARRLAQQLAHTGRLLAVELDPAGVLDEVVGQAPDLVGVDAGLIRVVEDDDLVVSAAAGAGVDELIGTRSPVAGRLSGDVVQSSAPLAVVDAGGDARLRRDDPLVAAGYRAFLGVPLAAAEGALHGVLAVYSRRPKRWREEEIEALQALAANASAALANAELYQRVTLANERSYAILANIADGIVAVNREGRVVLWNAAAEQITGVPADDALGRTPLDVLGRDLELEGAEGDRLVPLRRGDDEVWLSMTEAVMRDPVGVVAGRIFAFRDISADRMVEQMKSDFVSTVSQELRRPLTSIYGFAETLLRRDVLFSDDERRTFIGYITSESERLTRIVDALLNVARLDTGDLQVTLAPTSVAPVLDDVVSAAQAAAALNGHRFVVDVPSEPLEATADPEKLRLVVSHLVDNAVKYSPDGGTVTVAARRRGETVEVSVSDEGVGIPAAEQQRIFRKFYRAEGTPGRAGGGTGLGLFIARGLVTAMGGRIWVTSAEGHGSRFTFELPAARSAVLVGGED